MFFILDTGSYVNVISHHYVAADQIKPCDEARIGYTGTAINIIGKTTLTLTLGTGASSFQLQHTFFVTDKHANFNVLAMAFLTDFECEFDIDEESTLTLSRTPREPKDRYRRPFLYANLQAGEGAVSRTKFLVDTGGETNVALKHALECGMDLEPPTTRNGRPYYKVNDTVTLAFGAYSRVLPAAQAHERRSSTLGNKGLLRTVVSIKNWAMTFRTQRGGFTVPFLRR